MNLRHFFAAVMPSLPPARLYFGRLLRPTDPIHLPVQREHFGQYAWGQYMSGMGFMLSYDVADFVGSLKCAAPRAFGGGVGGGGRFAVGRGGAWWGAAAFWCSPGGVLVPILVPSRGAHFGALFRALFRALFGALFGAHFRALFRALDSLAPSRGARWSGATTIALTERAAVCRGALRRRSGSRGCGMAAHDQA